MGPKFYLVSEFSPAAASASLDILRLDKGKWLAPEIRISGEGNGTHSSTLVWKIPWMEKPGRLQSMGSLRVGHDRVTSLSLFLSFIGEGNGNPLQCSCLENPRDGGAWWAAVYGVAQGRTRLRRLGSGSRAQDVQCEHCTCSVSFWAVILLFCLH